MVTISLEMKVLFSGINGPDTNGDGFNYTNLIADKHHIKQLKN